MAGIIDFIPATFTNSDTISTNNAFLLKARFYFSENSEWFRNLRVLISENIGPPKISNNFKFRELRNSWKQRAAENIRLSKAPVLSVWHRPQCNIGPGISPVTITTMDDSRKRPGSPGLVSPSRRWRAKDEMNAHRMPRAITAAVVVVAAVTSTHTIEWGP